MAMVGTDSFDDFAGNRSASAGFSLDTCRLQTVKAVAVGQHNMCEETLFENPVFRRRMQEAGIALVWITPILDFPWNVNTGCNDALLTALDSLAETSGYDELKVVPIVPVGHSAMATSVELRRMESGTCLGGNFLSR